MFTGWVDVWNRLGPDNDTPMSTFKEENPVKHIHLSEDDSVLTFSAGSRLLVYKWNECPQLFSSLNQHDVGHQVCYYIITHMSMGTLLFST